MGLSGVKVDFLGRVAINPEAGGGGRGDQDRPKTPQDDPKTGQDDLFYAES